MKHTAIADLTQLTHLIRGIKVAMLTTTSADGSLRSRPMATQETMSDGALWFLTSANSPKVDEVVQEGHVNLSYSDLAEQRYVSVSGRATLVKDHEKVAALWSPALAAWFPLGLQDSQLVLLRVDVDSWEHWDCQAASMVSRDCQQSPLPKAHVT